MESTWSDAAEIAAKHGIGVVCKLPINPKLAAAVDAGSIELFDEDGLNKSTTLLEEMEAKQ